jgi:GR25 family glycosyltransferase involved in LPS biosynthesis
MTTAYIINVTGEQQDAVKRLKKSIKDTESDVDPIIFRASTPATMEQDIKDMICFDHNDWRWNWPMSPDEEGLDLQTGVYKKMYRSANQLKVIACAVSHMRVWEEIVKEDRACLVLESDAMFTRKFTGMRKGLGCIGLSDPRGATRKANKFHEHCSFSKSVKFAPIVNDDNEDPVPQGLAGGSAYWLEPRVAKEFLNKIKEVGMWPNDAFICRENFMHLRIVYPYYTKVQGVASTTTL